MDLNTANTNIENATEDDIRRIFEDEALRGEFVTLAREDEFYIQAAGEGDGPYTLEYRDGSEQKHFQAKGDATKEQVLRAFLQYRRGSSEWKRDFTWEVISSGGGGKGCVVVAAALLAVVAAGVFLFV